MELNSVDGTWDCSTCGLKLPAYYNSNSHKLIGRQRACVGLAKANAARHWRACQQELVGACGTLRRIILPNGQRLSYCKVKYRAAFCILGLPWRETGPRLMELGDMLIVSALTSCDCEGRGCVHHKNGGNGE